MYLPDCAACIEKVANGYTELPHAVLEIAGGESTCDYINDDCPAQCTTEHAPPEPGRGYDWRNRGVWECPDTGQRFRYCVHCDWRTMGVWDNNPVEVDGEWLCDPYEHGYSSCDDCGDYCDEDSMSSFSSPRGDWDDSQYLCPGCYDDAMEQRREESSGERVTTCRQCGTGNTYLDVYTETFVCECVANGLRARKRPVMVAA